MPNTLSAPDIDARLDQARAYAETLTGQERSFAYLALNNYASGLPEAVGSRLEGDDEIRAHVYAMLGTCPERDRRAALYARTVELALALRHTFAWVSWPRHNDAKITIDDSITIPGDRRGGMRVFVSTLWEWDTSVDLVGERHPLVWITKEQTIDLLDALVNRNPLELEARSRYRISVGHSERDRLTCVTVTGPRGKRMHAALPWAR